MRARPHLAAQVGRLAEEPFEQRGVTVTVERVLPAELALPPDVRLTLESPRARTGNSLPSPSFLRVPAPAREACDAAPEAGFEYDGETLRARVMFEDTPCEALSFYGGGLVAGGLLRNRRAITFWNTDAWCYGEETPALYQSHPFVLALRGDGRAVGWFADATGKASVRIGEDGFEFACEGQLFELYRIEAAHPLRVLEALAGLVGCIALPPLWALGYHQSRWSYGSAREMLELADEFRSREHSVRCALARYRLHGPPARLHLERDSLPGSAPLDRWVARSGLAKRGDPRSRRRGGG